MSWIKTCEGKYLNLDCFYEFCAYTLYNEKHNYGIKLTIRTNMGDEELIGFFSHEGEAMDFVNLVLSSPALALKYIHTNFRDLIAEHEEEIPDWDMDNSEEYKYYINKVEEFLSKLNIKEEETDLDGY